MARANGTTDLLTRLGEIPVELVPAALAILASRLAQPTKAPTPAVAPGEDRLLDAEEVGHRLGIDPGSVTRRRFPFKRKLSHRIVRYSEKGLLEWLDEHKDAGP